MISEVFFMLMQVYLLAACCIHDDWIVTDVKIKVLVWYDRFSFITKMTYISIAWVLFPVTTKVEPRKELVVTAYNLFWNG